MAKLELIKISKSYKLGNEKIKALQEVNIEFRENEFVSVLGPSGCGKTTLLNVIGGLDRYDQGDLIINDMSTKKYKDSDWDAYRNRSIGFVFQNYNLITHQTVLQNVEISMTLAGIPAKERKRRAIDALKSVGLNDQLRKKPNQMSGGQMQRVAIARALVNNPSVILADEPTGALDSHTSTQIMEILKEISKTRLVIMVTHNSNLAEKYSNRIIRLLDGSVLSDTNPIKEKELENDVSIDKRKKEKKKKTSMSFVTATSLSFKNLLTKKGRTIATSIAGSIGIIGVALVLALSNGLTNYIDNMQSDVLAGFPISIDTSEQSLDARENNLLATTDDVGKFTSEDILIRYDSKANTTTHTNILTENYFDYIEKMEAALPNSVSTISYTRGININLLAKGENSVVKYKTSSSIYENMGIMLQGVGNNYWQEMPDNEDFILSLYDLIGEGSRLPSNKNEIALVVDEYNRLDTAFFTKLGITTIKENYKLTDFIGQSILKVVLNNDFYTQDSNGLFITAGVDKYNELYNSDSGIKLTITGILRIKEDAASSYLSEGIVYTTALTDYIVNNAKNSEIATAQATSNIDVLLNIPFANSDEKNERLLSLGTTTTPTGINIYPKDFASKDAIKEYLDAYNKDKNEEDKVIYSDIAETITGAINTLISTVAYVLIAFAAISLIVSTIMIAIITYVSVIERTKEIGILRSVGARKKDISMVFITETLIIGFVAGLLGVGISYLLTIPINSIIEHFVNIKGIAHLAILPAITLILGSMALTLIAGLIPARMASKKDPVIALRTE